MPGHHSDAAIFCSVVVEDNGTYVQSEVNLKMNDCNRIIHLTVEIGDDDECYQNALYKVEALIRNLQELRKALPKGRALYLKIKKEIDDFRKPKLPQDEGQRRGIVRRLR